MSSLFDEDEEVLEQRKKSELAAQQRDDDLKAVLDLPAGRRVLSRIIIESGWAGSSFASAENLTAFNEGRRSIGCKLIAELSQVDASALADMARDAMNELALRQSTAKAKAAKAE